MQFRLNARLLVLSGVLVLLLVITGCSSDGDRPGTDDSPSDSIPVGKSSFVFDEYAPLEDKPLTVWTYRPPNADVQELPIVFVLHGFSRNATEYRDDWVEHAKEHEFLVVVPTFSEEDFPGGDGYNLGSMYGDDGELNPEPTWAYSAIEPVFDHVKSITGNDADSYALYGHSAGSQFAHRFLMFKPDNRARMVVAANAGWYTMPGFDFDFPYGLGESPATPKSLGTVLSRRLVILLGEEDNDPNDSSLRTTPEAMAQGEHRLERGKTFYDAAEEAADSLGVSFGWSLQTVPNVGHDNAGMADVAVSVMFEAANARDAVSYAE